MELKSNNELVFTSIRATSEGSSDETDSSNNLLDLGKLNKYESFIGLSCYVLENIRANFKEVSGLEESNNWELRQGRDWRIRICTLQYAPYR